MTPTSEQIQIILSVIDRIAPRYTFGYYSVDDIKQEAYLICLEGMEFYDPTRPLENFIAAHLSNKLKTFRRDKYFRKNVPDSNKGLNEAKKFLMDLCSIEGVEVAYETDTEHLATKDALDMVMESLTPVLRNDFLRWANGVPIQSYKRVILINRIKEILGEDW